MQSDRQMKKGKTTLQMPRLPAPVRFYIYGIQGYCYEITFTAFFNFFFEFGDWTLKGHSAISSFFIYGLCSFAVEHLYVYLYYKKGIMWWYRMPLYVCIAYSWEFITGLILSHFNACPWDYSHYPYNFMGLITLEYAPGWLFLAFVQDLVADYLLRIRLQDQISLHDKNMDDLGINNMSSSGNSNGTYRNDEAYKLKKEK